MSKVVKKADSFYRIYERKDYPHHVTHYCPGCGHGVLHKLIAEALDDFAVRDRTILISPVGCSVFAYYYFRVGNIQVAHGRAPAVATGIKRVYPGSIVISYQGDGDLAAIGANNILQAANRGEGITVFFVNNAIYGMTGGQMAPTTLVGQKTTTSPRGRDVHNEGYPMRVAELLATLDAPVYIERVALTDAKNTNKARRAVRKGIQTQMENKGFSLVEVLSACPSCWKMTPLQAKTWITDYLEKQFPLGVYRDKTAKLPITEPLKHEFLSQGLTQKLEIPIEKFKAVPMSQPEEKYLNPRIIVAGFGGQGILILGLGIAQAGMNIGLNVSWIPSYGPEMRGGTANCHVNLSGNRIGSPLVSQPSILIAMNTPSLEKFEKTVISGGLVVYDTSLIENAPVRKDVQVLGIPATRIADELGNARIANMVILGALLQCTALLTRQVVVDALPTIINRKNLIPLNIQAIDKGIEYVKQNVNPQY